MPNPLRLCLVLHNHQPVGNFDGVFEQAYIDSYRPFLDVFDGFPELQISLHTSGPLMEWLDHNHPEYLDRLAEHVAAGRIEIVGGAFYEPVLPMIPSRDRVGQITSYREWLQDRLGAEVQGMWVPERVWEQSLTSDIATAGAKYTVLDDYHFQSAGCEAADLNGYFVTEDEGQLLCVFPGNEQLRYHIPFSNPQATIDYLYDIYQTHENAVVVFGDDGEKFGTWPDTKKHVYEDGWLSRFFQMLTDSSEWLRTTTLCEAMENTPPLGKVYLPDASYREMTEWALPTDKQVAYEDVKHDFEDNGKWERIGRFVRGGVWRNFKVKYPETNEMYARMMMVSRRLREAVAVGCDVELLGQARRELYRGQCNCSYWHGAFGGIYLPHLRNAVFGHLIKADNLLDRAAGKPAAWVAADAGDYDLDARAEVRLANERLLCLLRPHVGGQMYELDVRNICQNLLATLSRRPEAYHRKVLAGPSKDHGDVASIHDRVVFKQDGLDQRLQYDSYERKSLIDHFFAPDANQQTVEYGQAAELGNFVDANYSARIRRADGRVQVLMTCDGRVAQQPIRITKGVTLAAGSAAIELAYMLEGLPPHEGVHFGVEFNFAALPTGADDRYFHNEAGERLGNLHTRIDLQDVRQLGMVDEWLGLNISLAADTDTNFWTYPIETVSQSEGGFELVHQSLVVQPHWHAVADSEGRWGVKMTLNLDTTPAELRESEKLAVVANA